MKDRGDRSRFLLLLAILFSVKIAFDCVLIRERSQNLKRLDALVKSTAETERKSLENCREAVKLCEKITGKPCGGCN